ncbi:hypothetical protein Goari_017762, partial [Gossypium aridum]|nr:hypothetical protein [Gossypium aridum]
MILKVNFDASYQQKSKKGIGGVVVRNSEGLDLGFREIKVEGDALTIIKKLHADDMDTSEITNIIKNKIAELKLQPIGLRKFPTKIDQLVTMDIRGNEFIVAISKPILSDKLSMLMRRMARGKGK